MSTSIDAATGLPMVNPSTDASIDQIPLGVQLFPWKDTHAASRPNRQVAYPDDILPTTALVTGLYQDAAQTVGTDGSHALLVYDVNEGGGGGGSKSPFPSAYGNGYEINPIQTAAGDANGKRIGELAYQDGAYFAFIFDIIWRAAPTTGASAPKLQFYLQSTAIQDLQVALLSITYPKSPITGFTYEGQFVVPLYLIPPLDMRLTFPNETDISMYMDCNTIGVFGSWTGYSSGGT